VLPKRRGFDSRWRFSRFIDLLLGPPLGHCQFLRDLGVARLFRGQFRLGQRLGHLWRVLLH
jgi:hypothetical protein